MRIAILITAGLAAATLATSARADAASEAQLKAQLDQAQAELAQYKDGFERAKAALAEMQAERDSGTAKQAASARSIDDCQAKNVYVIGLAEYLLKPSNWPRPPLEPFTDLVRVRLENAQQEYEDKIRAGRFDPKLDHPVAQEAAGAATKSAPQDTPAAAAPAKPQGGS